MNAVKITKLNNTEVRDASITLAKSIAKRIIVGVVVSVVVTVVANSVVAKIEDHFASSAETE